MLAITPPYEDRGGCEGPRRETSHQHHLPRPGPHLPLEVSPQPLRTPPRRGDSAGAAFFLRVQGCCWPHSPCLTVECGRASWGWDTLKTEDKYIVQVLLSPKGFKPVLGVGWRTHGQNRQCRIPGHTGDWAALSTLQDYTCPPHSCCHQPHLECVYLCVRARAPTHNNLYYSL